MAPNSRKLTREGLLSVLGSFGVSLPSTTKIPEEDLNKRFSQALDAAQRYRNVIGDAVFDPSSSTTWPSGKDLLEATKRVNIMEAFRIATSLGGSKGVSSDKKDTFKEMRQIVMGFADSFHKGDRHFCMIDKLKTLENWGVYVRIVEVYEVKDTPVYLLSFKELVPDEANSIEGALDNIIPGGSFNLVTIQTTEYERISMLKLLGLNAKRLSADYRPEESQVSRKQGLKMSFLLPLGPLNQKELGRLTNNTGCEICGKKNVSRCVQCLSVAYCGSDCQKLDWPNHKTTCRSLKGGTWKTLTFDPPEDKQYSFVYNNCETPEEILSRVRDPSSIIGPQHGPPPDVHNGKTFLVKFQIALWLFGEDAHMLLYDRQRSFQVRWKRKDQQDLFDEAEEALCDKLKMYKWARRVGDYQLEVCFDRSPSNDPLW